MESRRKAERAARALLLDGVRRDRGSLQDHGVLQAVGGGHLQHGTVGHLLRQEGIEGVHQVGALPEAYAVLLRGQVLGMTKSQIFRHITLLQMIKRIVPPISNEIITLVKDTSLARVIALQEVIWMGESFMKGNSGIAGLVWPLFFTAVYYLIFSGIVTVLLGKLEKKLDFFQ